jgi:hypothetical protein
MPNYSISPQAAAAELLRRREVNRDPVRWIQENATIVHPQRGRIAFDPYPYQRRFFEMYRSPRRLVNKARQIGFSQAFALEALHGAVTESESTILLVSRSQDMAVNLLRIVQPGVASRRTVCTSTSSATPIMPMTSTSLSVRRCPKVAI